MIPFTEAAKDSIAVNPTRNLQDEKGEADEDIAGGGGGGGDGNEDEAGGADENPCAKATNCKDCETASSQLSDDTEVCQWALGKSEALECMKKTKSEVEDMLTDMCSGSGANGSDSDASKSPVDDSAGEPTTSPPSKAPTSAGGLSYPEDEEGNGAVYAIVLLLVFVGIAYTNRDKMLKVLKAADGLDGMGGGGETGGSTSKPAKYHDVPGDDNDEEWGWGDDKDSTSGEIELPANESAGSIGSYKDEVVHKRGTSIDIKDPVSYGNQSAAPLSSPSRPVVPAPNSGGLNLPSSATNTRTSSSGGQSPVKSGMSLMSKQQKPKPKPVAKPPASAPVMPAPAAAQPMPTSATMPIPQRITSLGKKKPVAPAKPKPTTKPEDDIFASMGLSAKPKFSAPVSGGPKPAPASSSSGGSRWAMPANTAPAKTNATTTNTLSANFGDDGGDDDDWGDDDDLNDLLDD